VKFQTWICGSVHHYIWGRFQI